MLLERQLYDVSTSFCKNFLFGSVLVRITNTPTRDPDAVTKIQASLCDGSVVLRAGVDDVDFGLNKMKCKS